MPQLQIIPKSPGFGEQLGQALGSGLGQGISSQLNSYLQKKKNTQELQGISPFLEQLGVPKEGITQMIESGMPAQTALQFGTLLSSQRSAQQKAQQQYQMHREKLAAKNIPELAKQQEKQQEVEGLQNAFSQLDELIPYTGTTVIPGFKSFTAGGLNRQAVEKRELFDKLGFWLTDKTYTHFNKGTLSNVKFEEIKSKLAPRSDLSERENKARVSALKSILQLPANLPKKELDQIVDEKFKEIPEKIESKSSEAEKQAPIRAINPKTGQTLILKEGKWQPEQ